MWWLGFVFHEVAFGLLSVFIPLYIISLGGSLIHVGLMSSAAIFLSIPASLLWGYLCDGTGRYKPYILLSFLFLAILLYTLTLTTDIGLLIFLYIVMAFIHMAHEPPKNVLIAESYIRRCWERGYALYEGITEVGWLIGMLTGLYISIQGLVAYHILIVCSALNFMAFIFSIFLIEDPAFIFERSLVKVERSVLNAYRGLTGIFKVTNCMNYIKTSIGNSAKKFCLGLIAFFMATRILFTPLPIFLSRNLALPNTMIYILFCINSAGGTIGYFLMSKPSLYLRREALYRAAALRSILTFLLITVGLMPGYGVALAAAILFLLGLAYAVFHILSLSLSMETLPEKMTGIFNMVTGLGEALGSFIGSLIAEKFGFTYLFLGAGLFFFMACMLLKGTSL